MVKNRSRTDLDTDRMLNLALVRLMEIISEAATRVSNEFRCRHPQIPWREVTDYTAKIWLITSFFRSNQPNGLN